MDVLGKFAGFIKSSAEEAAAKEAELVGGGWLVAGERRLSCPVATQVGPPPAACMRVHRRSSATTRQQSSP